jgi:hypothetical protein
MDDGGGACWGKPEAAPAAKLPNGSDADGAALLVGAKLANGSADDALFEGACVIPDDALALAGSAPPRLGSRSVNASTGAASFACAS